MTVTKLTICHQHSNTDRRVGLTFDLRQAPMLLLGVLSDPPQVLQLGLQELALACSLQPEVALFCQLRLQLAHAALQGPAQLIALREGERGG